MKYFMKITVMIAVYWTYDILAQGGDICSFNNRPIHDAKIGVIYSPNYPSNYPPNMSCCAELESQANYLMFEIYDFLLEGIDRGNCNDYLLLLYYRIKTLCGTIGSTIFPLYYSPFRTSRVKFTFTSNAKDNYRGFILLYKTVGMPDTYELCKNSSLFVASNGSYGALTSPRYPKDYPKNKTCSFTIPDSKEKLNITAWFMNIRQGDSVDIISNGLPIVTLTGNKPFSYITVGRNTTLIFRSDNDDDGVGKGLLVTYMPVMEIQLEMCYINYVVNEMTGNITSPNYPSNYPHWQDCSLLMALPEGFTVRIWSTDFTLEADSSCNYDWLWIKDSESDTNLLQKTCGNLTNTTQINVVSQTNKVLLNFHTDGIRSQRGFQLQYVAIAPTRLPTLPTNVELILTAIKAPEKPSTTLPLMIAQSTTQMAPTHFATQAKDIDTSEVKAVTKVDKQSTSFVSTTEDGFLDKNNASREAVDLGPAIGGAIGGILLLILLGVSLTFIWRWLESKKKWKSRHVCQNCGFNSSLVTSATGTDNVVPSRTVQSLTMYETMLSSTSESINKDNKYTELQTARIENQNVQGNNDSEYQDTELHTTSKEIQNPSETCENQNLKLYTAIVENHDASENCDYENLQAELYGSSVENHAPRNNDYKNQLVKLQTTISQNQSSSGSHENHEYEYPCTTLGNHAGNNEYDYVDVNNK